ncbi:MAG TPA: hypothetical protein VLS94_12565, partial [Fusibacter sp.]|nr:hypothetical protein [Fusibacter sp.]
FEATIGFRILCSQLPGYIQAIASTQGLNGYHFEWYPPDNRSQLTLFRSNYIFNGPLFPFLGEIQIIYESSLQRYNIYLNKNLFVSELPNFGYSSLIIGGSDFSRMIQGYLKKCIIFNRILHPWEMRELMRLL